MDAPARTCVPHRAVEWVSHDDTYEFEEQIATSGYGDMLMDYERV